MKKTFILIILFTFLLSSYSAFAQRSHNLKGVVYTSSKDGKKEPVPFASVYWLQSGTYMDCDADGKFTFTVFEKVDATLVATAVGYNKDTINITATDNYVEFMLIGVNELEKAVVQAKSESNYLSKLSSVRTEVITAAGLCKMACCNLAESFENSASVSVGYSDAVTGARQIRLLGLSGIYTLMLDENRPVMRGLASPFGLTYIPGQWLESIQIAKGPSSVINGFEAITGQINMEHRKPTAEQPLYLNLLLSQTLKTDFNVASSLQLNEKWSTVILGHVSGDFLRHDGNGDKFRDDPMTRQFNVANRWLYFAPDGVQVRFGVRALNDMREGGQMDYRRSMGNKFEEGTTWGSVIWNKGINGYVKVGVPLDENNDQNIALVADYTYHQFDSFFGKKDYNANQNSVFANLMYQNTKFEGHRFTVGLRNQFDLLDETLKQPFQPYAEGSDKQIVDLGRQENSVGVFGEYTYNYDDKFTAVADLSLDYNNIHGLLFAPRLNLKYSIIDDIVVRAMGGRGFRSPNLIVDNLGMMSTGREIVFDDNLGIEDAWTFGTNITGYIPIGFNDNCYISFDYFRNDFNNQIIADQERDFSKVWLYNVDGKSYTNTYQVDFSIEPIERFTVMATFRYTDAKVSLHNKGLVERPLTSKYKGVLNLQYATRMNIWTFDFTAQLNGPSRLPSFMGDGTGADYSPIYPILFAQVTRKFKGVDVYLGGENLTNYRQPNPILEVENPFSEGFNASAIWGPLMGIKVHLGVRFTLWKK